MSKFNIDDRVVITNRGEGWDGITGTVTKVLDDGSGAPRHRRGSTRMTDLTPEREAEWRKDAEHNTPTDMATWYPANERILALLDALRDERTAREQAEADFERSSK